MKNIHSHLLMKDINSQGTPTHLRGHSLTRNIRSSCLPKFSLKNLAFKGVTQAHIYNAVALPGTKAGALNIVGHF